MSLKRRNLCFVKTWTTPVRETANLKRSDSINQLLGGWRLFQSPKQFYETSSFLEICEHRNLIFVLLLSTQRVSDDTRAACVVFYVKSFHWTD